MLTVDRPAHRLPDRSVPLITEPIGVLLRRTAERFAERDAFIWSEPAGVGRLSYRALLAQAEKIAYWLLERAQPGDRIAVWSRNSLEWLLLEYGCALAGMVVNAWNTGWTDYECEHARELIDPRLIFAGQDTRGIDLLSRAHALAAGRGVFALTALRPLVAEAKSRALPVVSHSDLFLIQFTSGTTGHAKGAGLSHRAVVNSSWLRIHLSAANESDVWLNPVPMHHIGGPVLSLGAMLSGGCYVVAEKFDAGAAIRMARLFGATRIGGVPTMLIRILEHPEWVPGSLQVRSVGAGAASVPHSLIQRLMREFAAPVMNTFGQSECPMISMTQLTDDAQMLSETVGRVVPHLELKIHDRCNGQILQCGEVGEICVRGPTIMDGYFRMPEATSATIDADGFLHTGDLGSLDERGYLRIHGRAREVIIRGGENIYPAEVEDALLGHPDVAAAAAVGVADERWGQQVGVAVVLREGACLDSEALEAHAAKRLAHFKVPRHWRSVNSLPVTASGKVRRVELEALFAAAEP